MFYCYTDTPIGRLLLAGENEALHSINFPKGKNCEPQPDWVEETAFFQKAVQQLKEYFEGKRFQFTLPLQLNTTPFQTRVLEELQKVLYGETVSYGELAEKIGSPKACRAVGMANANNPIPIIIPCHRVIGKDGKLTGFGGGLEVKKALLDLERRSRRF